MKLKTIAIVTSLAIITGCSSVKKAETVDAPSVTAIGNQKLVSNFKRRGIKIEYDCVWGTGMFGVTDALCVKTELKSIEVTAYAPSFGNSEVLRENAFRVAEDQSKAKLIRFLREDIKSSAVTKTISKNIEKANDRVKQQISSSEEVSMSEEDANKDTNYAIRENTNNTAREFLETVQTQAAGILRGVYVNEETIVDRQTVAVTIRWDRGSMKSARDIRSVMGK
jgi:hypothetical protein